MKKKQSEEYFLHQRDKPNGDKHWNGFPVLIGCLPSALLFTHHSVYLHIGCLFSLFIGLFQRGKIHFSPPNSPVEPAKCATIPDEVIIIGQSHDFWRVYSLFVARVAWVTVVGRNWGFRAITFSSFLTSREGAWKLPWKIPYSLSLLWLVLLTNCFTIRWRLNENATLETTLQSLFSRTGMESLAPVLQPSSQNLSVSFEETNV